jgi:hypothetical protein
MQHPHFAGFNDERALLLTTERTEETMPLIK